MSVDAQLITKLRELTGAGIGDCNVALDEASNDLNQAVEILRKKGALKAAKKSERQTKEGIIAVANQGRKISVVGLSCETDFVARNEDFIKTAQSFSEKLFTLPVEEFKKWAQDQVTNELIVKIGENIQLAIAEIIEGEVIGYYLHSTKKLAAVVVLNKGSQELAVDLAMQIAAMSPKYLMPEDVPLDVIEKEKEIYQEQLKGEDKPESMWDKIIPGKLNKYYSEVCLTKQPYIKEDKITIEQLLKQQGGEIAKFFRYQI